MADEQIQVASNNIARPPESLREKRQIGARNPRRTPVSNSNMPVPYARTAGGTPGAWIQPANFSQAQYCPDGSCMPGGGTMHPAGMGPAPMGPRPPMARGAAVSYDNPQMPGYAWPSYAASPNYAALTYPKQYSASAWPYIGPFYPYPQVPLGWRKVTWNGTTAGGSSTSRTRTVTSSPRALRSKYVSQPSPTASVGEGLFC